MQWMQKKKNLNNMPLFAYELEYQTGKVHFISISTRTVDPMHLLTHWGRVTICICVGNLIGSDNGLSPGRCQAIIWTNAEILLIGPLGTNFSEILIGIHKFPFTKIHLKMSSVKWRPFSLGLSVFTHCGLMTPYDDPDLGQNWFMLWLGCQTAPSH